MTKMIVKRQRYGPKDWEVRCRECESADFLAGMAPWAHTVHHSDALLLAAFHLELHEAQRCPDCGHAPTIERPVAASKGLFTIGIQPYALTPEGVQRLNTLTKENQR